MKKICLLGATGSIGTQTIDIIDKDNLEFSLVAVSSARRIEELEKIIESHNDIKCVCVKEEKDWILLQNKYPHILFFFGDDGLVQLIKNSNPDLVVNALVGFAGFVPSVYTVSNDIDLALANKESLVVGGTIINDLLSKHKGKLYPIDSEHVALAKCLEGKKKEQVKSLVITASGGSFRDLTREQLKNVSVEDALKHPSWSMGSKITIDSATMMNKGFEIIEAMHLFHFEANNIKVLLHDESVIHSMVEFVDHSFLADLGPQDMRIPIAHALYGNKRKEIDVKSLDLEDIGELRFRRFDISRYPCVGYALKAIEIGGTLPTILNASNEEAVYSFLNREISFIEIEEIIDKMMNSISIIPNPTVEDICSVDKETRRLTRLEIERRKAICK